LAWTTGVVTDRIFFYGTLMSSFRSEARQRVEPALEHIGPGFIRAVLYDLGPYPAAIPSPPDASEHPARTTHRSGQASHGHGGADKVCGELHRMLDPRSVLRELDDFEGYDASRPDSNLFVRAQTTVEIVGGGSVNAWVYFYRRPLSGAIRIESGDYLAYVRVRGVRPAHGA
jgi:gamma-glutamylcyclotransferase (GGCT)/AIG2-like uncharacterized protein YtfP